jgi:hypothetical protein
LHPGQIQPGSITNDSQLKGKRASSQLLALFDIMPKSSAVLNRDLPHPERQYGFESV